MISRTNKPLEGQIHWEKVSLNMWDSIERRCDCGEDRFYEEPSASFHEDFVY